MFKAKSTGQPYTFGVLKGAVSAPKSKEAKKDEIAASNQPRRHNTGRRSEVVDLQKREPLTTLNLNLKLMSKEQDPRLVGRTNKQLLLKNPIIAGMKVALLQNDKIQKYYSSIKFLMKIIDKIGAFKHLSMPTKHRLRNLMKV